MPLNCPIPLIGSCEGCHYYNGSNACNFYSIPQPLAIILTTEERISRLEAMMDDLKDTLNLKVPAQSLRDMRKDIDNTHGMLLHHQEELHKHIDASRPKKKEPKTKGAEI